MPLPDKYSSTHSFVMQKLRRDVGFFKQKGGTVGWMVNNDGIVIIDAQFKAQAITLLTQIELISNIDIDILFNTHHHPDHTGGNSILKDKTNKIISHTNSLINQRRDAVYSNTENDQTFPNLTFDHNINLTLGTEAISAQYLGPAHTNGDIVIHFEKANIVHIGDLVFNRCYPYIDKKNGASIANWITVLDSLLEKYDNDTIFITGHALQSYDVIIDKTDIKTFSNYLNRLMDYGHHCIKNGITKEMALADTKEIPGVKEWMGEGIERSIVAIYEELTKVGY